MATLGSFSADFLFFLWSVSLQLGCSNCLRSDRLRATASSAYLRLLPSCDTGEIQHLRQTDALIRLPSVHCWFAVLWNSPFRMASGGTIPQPPGPWGHYPLGCSWALASPATPHAPSCLLPSSSSLLGTPPPRVLSIAPSWPGPPARWHSVRWAAWGW